MNFGKSSDAFFEEQVGSIAYDETVLIQRTLNESDQASFSITELIDGSIILPDFD
jgi:hypothetical protein